MVKTTVTSKIVVTAAAVSWLWVAIAARQSPGTGLAVEVLSSRPEMVTGGDALVEIRSASDSADGLVVTVNGQDVSARFHMDERRRSRVGLVDGLVEGRNTLVATAGGQRAELELTNYPSRGPIFVADRPARLVCDTAASGLGDPLDDDCSAATKIEYFYKSTSPAAARQPFKPFPSTGGARPADLAQTTTVDGRRVAFIVRVESGTIDRAIYRIAILDDPAADAAPWTPGAGWNGRLLFTFGGGCGISDAQGVSHAADVLIDAPLARGFAIATSTDTVFQQHCNDLRAAEAVMMLKEHFIERYGVPKWTMGAGGSGGAIEQLLIAQNFPGLLDGILPSLAFPDAVTIAGGVSDCRLLSAEFTRHPSIWTPAKQAAVDGYAPRTCAAWDRTFVDVIVRAGARAGFAQRPLDNVGVQYGLKALNGGVITPAEFLTLNAGVGGFDAAGRLQAQRTLADPGGLRLAYLGGRVNAGAGGLPSIPILEYRGYSDPQGDIHDRARDFAVRERLRKANGTVDNHVLWIYPNGAAALGQRVANLALDTMTRWLDALASDSSAGASAAKVKRARPPAAVDACWDVIGTKIDEPAGFDRPGLCNALYPPHLNPRLVAGAPIADDVVKCQLKPIDPRDYRGSWTVADLQTLRRIFPSGVCDYTRPGVSQEKLMGTYLNLSSLLRPAGAGTASSSANH